MEALNAFRQYIDSCFAAGGWLPSVREMSRRFDISTGTCTKAINCLVKESVAQSYPRKGIYITPKKYRAKKMGLVLDNGRESPFICEQLLVSEILRTLNARGYYCHMIQGSPVSNVPRSAITHCTTGVIWYSPEPSAYQVLRHMNNSQVMPVVAICPMYPESSDTVFPDEIPVVMEDLQAMGNKLSEFIITSGHRKLAALGLNQWLASHDGLIQKLNTAGIEFGEHLIVEHAWDRREVLQQMIVDEKVKLLLIERAGLDVDLTFEELLKLPEALQPDVMIRDRASNYTHVQKYPQDKIIAKFDDSINSYGKVAVELLNDMIEQGRDRHSLCVEVQSFYIKPTHEKSAPVKTICA